MRTCGQERCYGGRAVDVEERQRQSDRRDPHRWMRITSQSLHRRIERFAHVAPREEDCLDGLCRHTADAIDGGAEDVRLATPVGPVARASAVDGVLALAWMSVGHR